MSNYIYFHNDRSNRLHIKFWFFIRLYDCFKFPESALEYKSTNSRPLCKPGIQFRNTSTCENEIESEIEHVCRYNNEQRIRIRKRMWHFLRNYYIHNDSSKVAQNTKPKLPTQNWLPAWRDFSESYFAAMNEWSQTWDTRRVPVVGLYIKWKAKRSNENDLKWIFTQKVFHTHQEALDKNHYVLSWFQKKNWN